MKQQTFLQHLETLGYYSLPRPHADSPGYGGLLVVLRKEPAGHEPEMVQLRLHEWDGKFSEARLRADINQVISHVVCPGRIVIRSHQEREATFYSFGGTLESEVYSEETVFSFRSNAPVLELLPEEETLADLLAEETEVLFARAEARHRFSTQQLLDRLVTAGPEAVYQAVLQSLLPDDEETADTHRHPTSFINMLQSERRWYQKNRRWPNFPRNLETLLQPE